MTNSKRKVNLRRVLGLMCALVLLICALYVPVIFTADAAVPMEEEADKTVTFGFEDSLFYSTHADNKAEFDATGLGLMGWSGAVVQHGGNSVWRVERPQKQAWATVGAVRLNKKVDGVYQVYNLEPSTRYLVSLKVRVTSSSEFTDDAKTPYECYVALGYGAKFNTNDTNYVSTLDKNIVKIVTAKAGSGAYTLATDVNGGTASYVCSDEWRNVVYEFTTPADLGSFDHALGLLGNARTGFCAEIDYVSVTKLGSDTGVAILVDEYSGKTETMLGKIGTQLTLADISDRVQSAGHSFEGWYSDAARTKKIETITFAKNTVKVYSGWKAPVTITFMDEVNNKSTTVTGVAGENFSYPADPVDPSNKSWFMGWYTSKDYTEEHTSGKFGYVNTTIYAYFRGEIPGLIQNFEEYPHAERVAETITDSSSGVQYKKYKNNLILGNTLTVQDDVTASDDSKYAVKFVWDKTMMKDVSNPNSPNLDNPAAYNAAKRYHEYDNFMWLGNGIENNQNYIISFKYKVEKADTKLEFYALSAVANNGWGNQVRYLSGYKTYAVSDEWQEASFQFATAFKTATSNYMYLGVHMEKNEDVILYIDDVEIKAVAQPYESLIIIDNGYDDTPINLKGVRGEAVNMPNIEHPSGAKFLGYYSDELYTEEFSVATFPRKAVTAYAKWGTAPIKFNSLYTYNTDGSSFGKSTLSISEEKGVGYDDDYALKFRFNGTDTYSGTTLMNTRYNQRDHGAVVAKNIESGALYHVSYYIKNSDKSTAAVTLTLGTGYNSNIWVNGCWKEYSAFKQTIDPSSEWVKVDFYFIPEVSVQGTMVGNALFLLFGAANDKKENFIEAYVDNVLVEKIEGDYIYFHGNAAGASDSVVAGKAGESFTAPTLTNGKSKFLGFFLDEGCTEPFTATVIPEGATDVYAKWETAPIAFDGDYPYPLVYGNGFGKLYSIYNAKGVGNGDDYALRFKLVGSEPSYMQNSDGSYQSWATRAHQEDHVVPILKQVDSGAVYRITYDYYVTNDTNVGGSITPVSGFPDNIWVADRRVPYNAAAVTLKKGDTGGWKTAEVYVSTNLKGSNDWLYLQIKLSGCDSKGFADIRIDNLKIEKIVAPYVFFDAQNGEDFEMVRGKAGDKIVAPTKVERFGYTFKGWYADSECTEKFTLDTFSKDTAVTAYAGWSPKSEVTYTFEKYDVYNGMNSKQYFVGDAVIDSKVAKSGKKALRFGNRTTGNYNIGASFAAIAHGIESCKLEVGYTYVVSFNYRAVSAPTGSINIDFVAGPEGHFWAANNNSVVVGNAQSITAGYVAGKEKQWLNKTFVINTNVIKEKGFADVTTPYVYLFLRIRGGENWDFYIDDVTVKKIPKGKSAICVDNMGCDKIPNIVIGTPGTSFASHLPENPQYGDTYFKGYFTKDAQNAYIEMKREDMKFDKDPITIYARFIEKEVFEGFEGDYAVKAESYKESYTTYDFDYEIYDSEAEGNSKDNVTGGRYSLHRKGDSMYFENAVILTLGNQIVENERYTVSFKVKMGKALQTDGAIKVVSGRSFRYAWTTTGDFYPVVAIADLADGEWHEVSYTFNSVEAFACIQTPGYVELFMDDFKFTVAGKETALSTPVSYTEYVPAKRDAKGNLLEKATTDIDVTSIIDISLYVDNGYMTYIYIGAGALIVLIGGLAAVLIIVKKKKKAKAKV